MNELEKVLEKHLKNIEYRFKRIPKSNKHRGILAEIQNKLDSTQIFADEAEKIVNDEADSMLKYINTNLTDKHTQEEVSKFIAKARKKLSDVIQKGIKDSLK
jgi:hypothetical protein